jgi:parallel beta-helix repeat protein
MRLLYLRLTLVFVILSVSAPLVFGAVWTVDDDLAQRPDADFTSIQAAINDASVVNGDTIEVYVGTYAENVQVTKQLNITGIFNVTKPTINAGKTGHGISLEVDNCVVQGFHILNAVHLFPVATEINYYVGILAGKPGGLSYIATKHHTLVDNDIHDCGHGILLLGVDSNNQIIGNSFYNNYYGIWAYWSNNNSIYSNNFTHNANGVFLDGASQNTVYNCTFSDHGASAGLGNAVVTNGDVFSASYNSVSNCTLDNDGISFRANTLDSNITDCTFNVDTSVMAFNFRCIYTTGNTRILIQNNNITGTLLQTTYDHPAISITYSNDVEIIGNNVTLMYRGIDIYQSSNIYMRDNKLTNNYYNFHFAVDTSYTTSHFNHDIDTSNTVDGNEIHWIDGATSTTIDLLGYPNIGYLALLNSTDITVDSLALSHNSQGVLLYNTTDTVISGGSYDNNRLGGVELYSCENITVQSAALQNNGNSDAVDDSETGRGAYLYDTNNSLITDCTISNNWRTGVHIAESQGNNVTDCDLLDNGEDGPTAAGTGVKLTNLATGNTIHSNEINSTVPSRQKYGVWSECTGNTIYNNIFDQTVNAYASADSETWHITPTSGTNIISGTYLGGNYWKDYTGGDNTHDGLGDTDIPWTSGGTITHGGDSHPLTQKTLADSTAPTIVLTSPQNGATYTSSNVPLKASSPDLDVDHWWYNLDGGPDIIFTPDTTIPSLNDGSHTVVIHIIDTSTNENQETVTFTVDKPSSGGVVAPPPLLIVPQDESEFSIDIISPSGQTNSRSINVRYSSPYALNRASYCLDGGDTNRLYSSSEVSRLKIGAHKLVVVGEDYYGRVGRGEVEFEVVPIPLSGDTFAGTPDYPDDVAYSFIGKAEDYMLSYEAYGIGNEELMICINQLLEDDDINNLVDLHPNTTCLGYIPKTSGWNSFNVTIPHDSISVGATNIVSFIHTANPSRYSRLNEWKIRNLMLVPIVEVDFPQISVQFDSKSVSSGTAVAPILEISGVTSPEYYDLYVYIVGPNGIPLYYPSWVTSPTPLESYYLETNFYGELNQGYSVSESNAIYTLVGKITYKDSLDPIALSMDTLYYSNSSSIDLILNSEQFRPGDSVSAGYALTTSGESMNGSVLISLETPDEQITYLPMDSTSMKSTYYQPLTDVYVPVISETITDDWDHGSYILRGRLFDENGTLIGEDIELFTVSIQTGTLEGIIFTMPNLEVTELRLRFFNTRTLELIGEYIREGSTRSYSLELPTGQYFVTGEIIGGLLDYQSNTREYGTVYPVPFMRIKIIDGETSTMNIMTYTSLGVVQPIVTPTSWTLEGILTNLLYKPSNEKISLIQDAQCPNPKVFINSKIVPSIIDELLQEFPGDNPATLNRFYCLKLQESLSRSSSNIDLSSYGELLDALSAQEKLLLENPGKEANLEFAQKLNAEYLTSLSIGKVGEVYVVSISLMDLDLVRIVSRVTIEGNDINQALGQAVSSLGNIGQVIRDWERTHPVPPRKANLQINVEPGTISPEEDKNTATVRVKVTNCMGEPVVGTPVYFDHITDRGYLTATHPASGGLSSYVHSVTNDEGYATAKYTLYKGLYAGEDHIDIFTKERGNRRVTGRANLKITGLKMRITAENQTLAPFETTLVHVDVFSVDESGEETPLEGAHILIESSYLKDSKMLPLGALNEDGMPITGANGRATFRFIAGSKEGIVDIPARYQALGYDMSIREVAQIEIKSEQYLIKVSWTETLNQWTNQFGTGHLGDWYSGGAKDTLSEIQRTQRYNLDIETTWDERSGREETDANLVYSEEWQRDDWAKEWWFECFDWDEKGLVSGSSYARTETGIGGGDVDITGSLDDYVTINTKLRVDAGKNIYLYCNPIRVNIPLFGDYEYGYDTNMILEADYFHRDDNDNEPNFVVVDTDSEVVSASHDYSGEGYRPDPRYWSEKVKNTGNPLSNSARFYRGEDYKPVVYLRKTGKNTYESYSYEYSYQRNGYMSTMGKMYGPGAHGIGEYYWRLNLLEGGEWIEVDFKPYTLYNTWEYSRKFTITVVKK